MTRPEGDAGPSGEAEPGSASVAPGCAVGFTLGRTVALVGLMGAGKTSVGRRLAQALALPFRDADDEIEKAAGLSIQDIFDLHGEAEFRRGERRVVARLIAGTPKVLATGGGAFINAATRSLLKERAITIWLRADIDVLMKRVLRRDHRPLLKEEDPRAVMERLIETRYPIYASADITIESGRGPREAAVRDAIDALRAYVNREMMRP